MPCKFNTNNKCNKLDLFCNKYYGKCSLYEEDKDTYIPSNYEDCAYLSDTGKCFAVKDPFICDKEYCRCSEYVPLYEFNEEFDLKKKEKKSKEEVEKEANRYIEGLVDGLYTFVEYLKQEKIGLSKPVTSAIDSALDMFLEEIFDETEE